MPMYIRQGHETSLWPVAFISFTSIGWIEQPCIELYFYGHCYHRSVLHWLYACYYMDIVILAQHDYYRLNCTNMKFYLVFLSCQNCIILHHAGILNQNIIGPRTEPWGTPLRTLNHSDSWLFEEESCLEQSWIRMVKCPWWSTSGLCSEPYFV